MRVARFASALAAAVGLSACASPPPTGPTVLALPGPNKTLGQFQLDDASCRNYAQIRIGGASSPQAAAQSGVKSAVVGTAVGAAAGAAIGAAAGNAGAGAAIGAGTGLAVGAGAGATRAAYSGAAAQQAYDASYIQCMVANGDKLQSYPVYAAAGPGPYAYLPYPYPYPGLGYGYGYPGYFGGPVIAFGFGGGWGGWHGGWGRGYHGGGRWWHH